MRPTTGLMGAVLLGVLITFPAGPRAQSTAEVALRAAIETETVKGDLKAAMEQFRALAAGPDRAVAAMALVHLGGCAEKLGQADARRAYEQVVAKFGDQADAVAQARARLAALGITTAASTSSVRALKVADTSVLAMSADGQLIAEGYGEAGLRIRNRTTGAVTPPLTRAGAGRKSWVEAGGAFSPDGRQIAYAWWDGNPEGIGVLQLRVGAADGSGESRVVYRTDNDTTWFVPSDWTPDGRHVLATLLSGAGNARFTTIAAIDVTNGTVRPLKKSAGSWVAGPPRVSPDGAIVVYAVVERDNGSQHDIVALSMSELSEWPVAENPGNDSEPVWTPDGSGILFRSDRRGTNDLWLQPVVKGRVQGAPAIVHTDVGPISVIGMSRSGSFAYSSTTSLKYGYTASFDPATGRASGVARLGDRAVAPGGAPFWSPDGRTVALLRPQPTRLAIYTPATGNERELPLSLASPMLDGWFPDGRSVLLSGVDGDGKDAFVRYHLDPPRPERLPRMGVRWIRPSISPDGSKAYAIIGSGKGLTISAVDLATGVSTVLAQPESDRVQTVAVSPDGRQLAYETVSGQAVELWLLDLGGSAPRRVGTIRVAGPTVRDLVWSPDARFVFQQDYDERAHKTEVLRVSVTDASVQRTGFIVDGRPDAVSVSGDGRKLAAAGGVSKTEAWIIDNLLPVTNGTKPGQPSK